LVTVDIVRIFRYNKKIKVMKNLQGKKEDLKLYNDNGVLVYEFYQSYNGLWSEIIYDDNGNPLTFKESLGYWAERTYDDNGNKLTYKNSKGYCYERTYDDNGNELTFKDSKGDWYEYTRDDNGNELTFKHFDGYWYERTYDDQGNELTFKHSDGVSRGFNIPEYTMEELTRIVGKEFKIKK